MADSAQIKIIPPNKGEEVKVDVFIVPENR